MCDPEKTDAVTDSSDHSVPTEQVRQQTFSKLDRPRELVLVCPDFKSNVNLSRIVRLAGCCAVEKIIASGKGKIDPVIARDAMTHVAVERRRSLLPVLKKLRADGYRLVGLEQTDRSTLIHDYRFPRRTALVIGHERLGIADDQLSMLDDIIELPVYGLPYSLNVVTATTMAVYEYCKQFPSG
jgi:tRNA G18 (ribose-2'-O)-methylase SpoU